MIKLIDILKEVQKENSIKFTNPNFELEWGEAKRYPNLFKSKKDWLDIAKKGKIQDIDCSMNISNTDMCDGKLEDLDPKKVNRAKKALDSGTVELPIVIKTKGGYELLGGNTRLTALKKNGYPTKAWVIEILNEQNSDHHQATVDFEGATSFDTSIDEISMKKAAAIGAMGLATLGSPKSASGQNFQGLKDKFKAGITAVKDKLTPQQKTDTVKIQKDAPLVLAKYKDDKGIGYGIATSADERGAMDMALMNAKGDLMKKLGKINGRFEMRGVSEKDSKLYRNTDGTYVAEVIVHIIN